MTNSTLTAPRKRRGLAAAIGIIAVVSAALFIAPVAHADGGSGGQYGGVGTVCGAEPGSTVRVSQSNEFNIGHLQKSWDAAIDGQERAGDPAGAAQLAAQVKLNTDTKIGQSEIVGDGAMTYRARVGSDGCLVVPALGMRDQAIRVQAPASKVNGVVEYESAVRLVENGTPWADIFWDDMVTSRSPKLSAPERGYSHDQTFGYDIDFHIDIK